MGSVIEGVSLKVNSDQGDETFVCASFYLSCLPVVLPANG